MSGGDTDATADVQCDTNGTIASTPRIARMRKSAQIAAAAAVVEREPRGRRKRAIMCGKRGSEPQPTKPTSTPQVKDATSGTLMRLTRPRSAAARGSEADFKW